METSAILSAPASVREDEYEDILALLMEHRTQGTYEETLLAREMAMACMGDNHLWQDMGLPDRQRLSDLIAENFHSLHVRNVGNMKWKKFFYKQLCEKMGVNACRSPSCSVCTDYGNCFGPESIGARPM